MLADRVGQKSQPAEERQHRNRDESRDQCFPHSDTSASASSSHRRVFGVFPSALTTPPHASRSTARRLPRWAKRSRRYPDSSTFGGLSASFIPRDETPEAHVFCRNHPP